MDPEPVFPFTQTFEGSRRVASLTNTLAPQPWTARWYLVSFTNPLASEMLLCFISLDISPPTEGRDSTVSLSGCCITCPRKEKRLLSLNNIVCAQLRTPATWAKTSVYPSADGGAAPLNPGSLPGSKQVVSQCRSARLLSGCTFQLEFAIWNINSDSIYLVNLSPVVRSTEVILRSGRVWSNGTSIR